MVSPMEEITTVPLQDDERKPHHERKPYVTPTLTDFGSCADLTQGNPAVPGPDIALFS
jgi:hypothetical protein